MSLSVFNKQPAPPVVADVPIRNSGWNAIATIMAARKLADSIEKAADKRARTGRVSNGASPVHNDRMKALQTGLTYFCDSVERISQYIRQNPRSDIAGSLKEAIGNLEDRIDALVQSVDDVNASGETIKYQINGITSALDDFALTADWINHRFYVADDSVGGTATDISGTTRDNQMATPCWGVHICNASFGNVLNSFSEVYANQRG